MHAGGRTLDLWRERECSVERQHASKIAECSASNKGARTALSLLHTGTNRYVEQESLESVHEGDAGRLTPCAFNNGCASKNDISAMASPATSCGRGGAGINGEPERAGDSVLLPEKPKQEGHARGRLGGAHQASEACETQKQDAQKQGQHRNKSIRGAREETHGDDEAVDRARQLRFARAQVRVRVCLGGRPCVSVYQCRPCVSVYQCISYTR